MNLPTWYNRPSGEKIVMCRSNPALVPRDILDFCPMVNPREDWGRWLRSWVGGSVEGALEGGLWGEFADRALVGHKIKLLLS